jgi:large subunit ribosomal protein L25
MVDKIELTVQDREVVGKKVSALRRRGLVPAVMYGQDFAAKSVMAEEVPMTKAVAKAGKHQPIEISIGSTKHLAMIMSTDFDPVKRKLRHVAFHVIDQNEEVETSIPVVVSGEGETPAEKAGLVVLTTIDSVEVRSLPNNLPEKLEVPGEKLAQVGGHATVSDIIVPKGVTVTSDPEQIIATVYEPSALQAANEAAGGEAETEALPEEDAETSEASDGKGNLTRSS